MRDELLDVITEMLDSNGYLEMGNLKDGYSYKIDARNAYVGVWVETKSAFAISRYKSGPNPYLFHEFHWDTGEPYGTVKPLELIEKCPITLNDHCSRVESIELLNYLNRLEEDYPILKGYNSLQNRKASAAQFELRLAGKLNTNSQ